MFEDCFWRGQSWSSSFFMWPGRRGGTNRFKKPKVSKLLIFNSTIILWPKITSLFICEELQENELQRFWLVSAPPELSVIKCNDFRQGETFAMVKVAKAMQLNTKDVEPMLNPLKRDLGRDSNRLVRSSMFDSFENETNCILPMMDQFFFYQRDTRPVGEMR